MDKRVTAELKALPDWVLLALYDGASAVAGGYTSWPDIEQFAAYLRVVSQAHATDVRYANDLRRLLAESQP